MLGAILGSGWFCGHIGPGAHRAYYGTRPSLLAQLRIDYADGTVQHVVTDASWRATAGPIVSADLLMGEMWDRRTEAVGWDSPDFDDGDWQPVEPAGPCAAALVADLAEPVRVLGECAPVSVTRLSPDRQIVDLGQNIAGWVRLRVGGERGTRIQLRFAEMLAPDGSLYTETYEPPLPPIPAFWPGVASRSSSPGSPVMASSTWKSRTIPATCPSTPVRAWSSARIRRCQALFHARTRWSISCSETSSGASAETSSPCPPTALSGTNAWAGWPMPRFRADRLLQRGRGGLLHQVATRHRRCAATRRRIPSHRTAPGSRGSRSGPRRAGLERGGIIIPWTLYQMYGDTRVIEEHYEAMARRLAYISDANPDGIWRHRRGLDLGDWLATDAAGATGPLPQATRPRSYWPRHTMPTACNSWRGWRAPLPGTTMSNGTRCSPRRSGKHLSRSMCRMRLYCRRHANRLCTRAAHGPLA